MTSLAPPLGIIAGAGRPPFLVASGMRKAGRRLVVAGLKGLASERLVAMSDEFAWCGLARIGSWIRLFHRHGVKQAVMIGSVSKKEIYSPFRFLRYVPDLRTAKLFFVRVRNDRRDNAILLAVADELKQEGIELVSCVKYCDEHLADEGLMTRKPIKGNLWSDVEFGWRIARASADLDIGQAIAVHENDIVAVEAIEGTDAMIRRAGRLCRVGGWTLIKVARPKQDMRFDVPTIGPSTIRNLKNSRCSCLAIEAGKTMIVDKTATLELADKLDIAVVGIRTDRPLPRAQS
ncbi:MAG: LpxI family protein [Planctomycetes bacterium]|jgi:DUF1009 family protein|nr:LpxI family protein [Planctomycetota bacterium]